MMPTMKAASAALVALVLLTGCGGDPDSGTDRPEAVGQEDLNALEDRVAELEALADDLGARDDRLTARLGTTAERLRGSISALRSSLRAAENDAAGALDDAAAAAARVEQVARNLSVLTERYDYHLRRYHGSRQ